ncbi:MAG TPA: response regulator, partial [Candidatus Binatia bacterium]
DDQHFCELYQMALGTEGYEVTCANTGRDALAMIPNESPDLIILDVMMPEVDGYEVCRTLREMPQFALTPIIMLTALSTDDEKIKGYNVGADDYLTKPFPLKILKAKVRSLVERRAAARPAQPGSSAPSQQPAQPSVRPPTPPTPFVQQPTQPSVQPRPAAPEQTPPPVESPMHVFEPPHRLPDPPQPQVPPAPPPAPYAPPPPVVDEPKVRPEPAPPVRETPQPTVVRDVPRQPPPPVAPGPALRAPSSQENSLDLPFVGPIPEGSNILAIGGMGCGKSAFSRMFISQGLEQSQSCMFICLDDDPSSVRKELAQGHPSLASHESANRLCFVDAYSCGGKAKSSERFAVRGTLDLSDLSTIIADAAMTIGQTMDQNQKSGRRVIDSISSLFLNFDLPYVQRFIAYLARSGHFAGVTTIFVVEDGTLTEQSLNNIKYIVDGVLEFKRDQGRFLGRTQALKWAPANPEWHDITRATSA